MFVMGGPVQGGRVYGNGRGWRRSNSMKSAIWP